MFGSVNQTFGCCGKFFGCSNKILFGVPNIVAVTKPFFSVVEIRCRVCVAFLSLPTNGKAQIKN